MDIILGVTEGYTWNEHPGLKELLIEQIEINKKNQARWNRLLKDGVPSYVIMKEISRERHFSASHYLLHRCNQCYPKKTKEDAGYYYESTSFKSGNF